MRHLVCPLMICREEHRGREEGGRRADAPPLSKHWSCSLDSVSFRSLVHNH